MPSAVIELIAPAKRSLAGLIPSTWGREHVLQEIVVDLEVDLRGEGVGVLVTRVRRVTFLPQELRGA